jgi:hypothetical protein
MLGGGHGRTDSSAAGVVALAVAYVSSVASGNTNSMAPPMTRRPQWTVSGASDRADDPRSGSSFVRPAGSHRPPGNNWRFSPADGITWHRRRERVHDPDSRTISVDLDDHRPGPAVVQSAQMDGSARVAPRSCRQRPADAWSGGFRLAAVDKSGADTVQADLATDSRASRPGCIARSSVSLGLERSG